MKLIGIVLVAGIALSLLKAALWVLVAAGIIVFAIGFLSRPAETIGLLLLGVFANLVQAQPVGAIWLISLALLIPTIRRSQSRRGHRPYPLPSLLPPGGLSSKGQRTGRNCEPRGRV